MGFRADKNAVAAKADLLRYDHKNSSEEKNIDLLNTVYEFRYKLKQYNNFYEKHKKYEELLRIERVKEKLQYFEFNPIAALNLLDDILSIEVEMLDLQQQMYLFLLDIIAKTPGTDAINLPLSQSRSMAVVRQVLQTLGSDSQAVDRRNCFVNFLSASGRGSAEPILDESGQRD